MPGRPRWLAALSDRAGALAASLERSERRRATGRRAFVFTGGANGGAVQVGQLRALVDAGITPDLVVGVSVGALHAAFVADRSTRDAGGGVHLTDGALDELEATWAAMSAEKIFGRRGLAPALALVRSRPSLFPDSGIRELIASMIREPDRADLGGLALEVSVGTCDLSSGTTRWWDEGRVLDVLAASVAIPGILPPVRLDGAWHIDGGVLDNVPLCRALALGAREIWVLDATGSGPDPAPGSPLGVLLAAFDTVRSVHQREALAGLGTRVPIVWLPNGRREIEGPLRLHDFSHTAELIEISRTRTAELVARHPAGRMRRARSAPAVDGRAALVDARSVRQQGEMGC